MFLTSVVCVGAVLFLLVNSREASDAVFAALSRCASSLIPALFPLTVISGVFIRTGAASFAARRLGGIFRRIFGVRSDGAAAIFIGAACGFPTGAIIVRDLREAGCISDDEVVLLIPLADNVSPAFVVGVVGGIYGAPFGFFLFAWQLIAAFIAGRLFSRQLRRSNMTSSKANREIKRESLIEALSSSIKSAASAMISVVSCVVFFSLIAELLSDTLALFVRSEAAAVLTKAVFEFSGTPSAAVALNGWIPAAVTGFAVGWSSLSVAAQVAALCGVSSMKLWFPFKLTQGIITAAGAALFETYIGIPKAAAAAGAFNSSFNSQQFFAVFAAILSAIFAVCVSSELKKRSNNTSPPR